MSTCTQTHSNSHSKTTRHRPTRGFCFTHITTLSLSIEATETIFKCQQAFSQQGNIAICPPHYYPSLSHNPQGPRPDHLAGLSVLEECQTKKSDLLLHSQRSTTPIRLGNKGLFYLDVFKAMTVMYMRPMIRWYMMLRNNFRTCVKINLLLFWRCQRLAPPVSKPLKQVLLTPDLYSALSDTWKQTVWPVRWGSETQVQLRGRVEIEWEEGAGVEKRLAN